MIHYAYKCAQSGYMVTGWADKIRVCYTPEAIKIFVTENDMVTELVLSDEWNDNSVVEFNCDKFSLEFGE